MKKFVTFSYDDGITQDRRLIEILDKYGLKCTFNLNSQLLGTAKSLICEEKTVAHVKPRAVEVKEIYQNHEVAAHTLTHPHLYGLPEEELIRQVEEDRKILSEIMGYEVQGMAYPYGDSDDRIAEVIGVHTKIRYARTVSNTHNFEPQTNLLRFHPTVYHREKEQMMRLAREFVELQTDTPKLFYIWGHSYEFDIDNSWAWFEEFCKIIGNKEDIYYGTNTDVLEKMGCI